MTSAELPPPLSSPSSSPRLPLELLAHIVQEAVITYVIKSRWQDAAACCLLSKSFLPFAQRALYHTVLCRGIDDYRDKYGYPLSAVKLRKLPTSPALRLIRTLKARAQLAQLIIRINLDFPMNAFTPTSQKYLSQTLKL
jgi:hypothetical protein